MTDLLGDALVATMTRRCWIRFGVVASTVPLLVVIDGATVPVSGYLSSYAPVVGHVVLILADGANMVILGRFVV